MAIYRHVTLGVVGILALAGAVTLVLRSTWASVPGTSDPTDPLQTSPLSDSRARRADLPQGSLDLLDSVRVSQDAVAGTWGFQDRALITSSIARGRLQLPIVPPDEYDLAIRATRKQGVNALHLTLVVNGVQGLVTLDGGDYRMSWISLSNSISPFANETAVTGKVLKWNKPATLKIQVRKSRISISVDDRPLIAWEGNPNELTVDPALLTPHPKALAIGSSETIFRIDEFVLTPLSDPPTLLRNY